MIIHPKGAAASGMVVPKGVGGNPEARAAGMAALLGAMQQAKAGVGLSLMLLSRATK
jgi:hypothetical protein